jgi:hypothetical protein
MKLAQVFPKNLTLYPLESNLLVLKGDAFDPEN